MLIDPIEVALNDLHQALREQADHLDDAATLLETDAASGLFRSLAEERRQMALDLEPHILKIALPKSSNPEKELVQKIITRAKAAFSSDERSSIIRERLRADEQLNRRVTTALRESVTPELRHLLAGMAERLSQRQGELNELLA